MGTMMKLTEVTITKYKSIQKTQTVAIDTNITVVVGMNESGKTSFLNAIAKTNYFTKDEDFEFDTTQDYPRNELIDFQHSEEESEIISCVYEISDNLLKQIELDLGANVFLEKEFTYTCFYKDKVPQFGGINTNYAHFINNKLAQFVLSVETQTEIKATTNLNDIAKVTAKEGDNDLATFKTEIKRIIDGGYPNWENKLSSYVAKTWINTKMPKFWYFDDYYPLPGKININKLKGEAIEEKDKTAKALFELAKIKPEDIISSSEKDYEKYIAQLEASSNKITNEIFKYWSTNKNLDIDFKIQELTNASGNKEKVLDIRVRSQRHKITLPLDRRSKGFNWFFSFIVWFSKIQANKNQDYILLLDEPGLNLHASAQADLLKFIEELSKQYQIIYTTHSPFMVESSKLDRVRTCLETEKGTIISESIEEKDSNTLFPLQAALGYDIAQNLFISKNNLIIEGVSDLLYLTVISNILQQEKNGLSKR